MQFLLASVQVVSFGEFEKQKISIENSLTRCQKSSRLLMNENQPVPLKKIRLDISLRKLPVQYFPAQLILFSSVSNLNRSTWITEDLLHV